MKHFLLYFSAAIFALFIGAQITEGVLLVPYWQSLSTDDFYSYYNQFGHSIGQFYTILTITAALIPIAFAIYCKLINSKAFSLALASSSFAFLFIACFYVYFKGANELFFQSALTEIDLKKELITWTYWHWSRVVLEITSLILLILSFIKFQKEDNN